MSDDQTTTTTPATTMTISHGAIAVAPAYSHPPEFKLFLYHALQNASSPYSAINLSSDCTEFAASFEVIYTEDDYQPDDTVEEIYGRVADINDGHGKGSVWLRVHRASRPSQMINNITSLQSGVNAHEENRVRVGLSGSAPYVQWSKSLSAEYFVTDIGLWRSRSQRTSPPPGWDGRSHDINEGRGGTHLYLVWKVKQYRGPRFP